MYTAFEVASFIYNLFERENGFRIDEMRLHKYLYFAQREAIVQTNEPLFKEEFEAWKYGPVMPEIRIHYKHNDFSPLSNCPSLRPIVERVFSDYVHYSSWALSMMSHEEESWKIAREGIQDGENYNVRIKTKYIEIDAQRVKSLRGM